MKRILAFILLCTTFLLSSCFQSAETTTTTAGTPADGEQPPAHPSYHFHSFDEVREALFVTNSSSYTKIRANIVDETSQLTTEQRQPYARMLALYESRGTFPMPQINGVSMEERYLAFSEIPFAEPIVSIYMAEGMGLPMIEYDLMGDDPLQIPKIRIVPLIASDDPIVQNATDIKTLHSYVGVNYGELGECELQLADRTVPAVYRYFNNNQEDGRYEYVFLYDGMYVRVIDTPEVLTDEFWSSFSIGEASK